MIRPTNETENSLLSITENCETLIKQFYEKLQEILEFKLTQTKMKKKSFF